MKTIVLIGIAMLIAAPTWAGGTCNQPPTPIPDTVRVGYSGSHLFDPSHNDSDPDGDVLAVSSIQQTACAGTLELIDEALVRYRPGGQPPPGGSSCQVQYTVTDGQTSRAQTVTLIFPSSLIFTDGFESGTTGAWEVLP